MAKQSLENLLKLYDYRLPKGLIAQKPASPRDAARLLVYDRKNKKVFYDRFYNLAKYLPKNSVLVFNQTKVWPARFSVRKPTGGKSELLYISHDKKFIKVIGNKKLVVKSYVELFRGREKAQQLKVAKKMGNFYFLKPGFPLSQIKSIMAKYGQTPIPPYIKHTKLSEKQLRQEYQSIFAKLGLSVAAPTASLHFTKQLTSLLRKTGIEIKFIRLDVGLGTFAPVKERNFTSGKLHREFYNIDKPTAEFLNRAKRQGRPIIAVGTTVVRSLEAAANRHRLKTLSGSTGLFIRDGYQFKFVDGLITNFHVPKSSLMMLVAVLTGRKVLLKLYNSAITRKFRFFSFGDGMLVLPF